MQVHETEGHRLLDEWISEDPRARTCGAIARAMGISQPAVSAWKRRRARPEGDHRDGLESLTDGRVPARSWETSAEAKARSRMLASVASSPLAKTGS